jgi:hypothetical protein
MGRNDLSCPRCSGEVPNERIGLGVGFACGSCGAHLRISHVYRVSVILLSFCAFFAFSLAIGLKGIVLFFAATYGWIPLYFVVALVAKRIVSPKIILAKPKKSEIPSLFSK